MALKPQVSLLKAIKPSNPPKPKWNYERVCVLTGRQTFDWTPGRDRGPCLSRIHGHCTGAAAERLVSQEQAEWVMREHANRRGGTDEERVPAIRLTRKKTWKALPSGATRAKVKVMQLVP